MEGKPLLGKVAIVTGAASRIGLGHAMTLALVAAGARVAMMDINTTGLAEAAAEARAIGGDDCVLPIPGDVSRAGDAERSVEQTISALGGVHILINNAGKQIVRDPGAPIPWAGVFWETPPDQWDTMVAINFSGAFYMARAVVPHMLAQRWGRIIGVTTSVSAMAGKGVSPYGPTKAGHDALVATMAGDLEDTGVTANVLVPGGLTMTGMVPPEIDQTEWFEPEIVQRPVVWLASVEADDFNGRRVIACDWDDELPVAERIAKGSLPLGWPIPTGPGARAPR